MIALDESRKVKRIEIINFMNHVHTVLDLADGMNVITGGSDNGKTAILRALYSVYLDKHDSTWIRHGEKEYTIRLTFYNGDIFEKTKGKNNIVKMIPFGEEPKSAQSYGKDLPLEYKHFIGLIPETSDGPLPFSMQKKDLFLVDKSGATLGQEISVLLQVDDLEKGAANLKKDLTKFNTQIKELDSDKETFEIELENYVDVDDKIKISEQLDNILTDYKRVSDLAEAKQRTINDCLDVLEENRLVKKLLKKTKNIYDLLERELVDIENLQNILKDKSQLIDAAIEVQANIEQNEKNKKISEHFINGELGKVVDKIIVLETTITDKNTVLDEVELIEEQSVEIENHLQKLKNKIQEYDNRIQELEQEQKTTKVLCSSCNGEGYVSLTKGN